MRLYEIIPEYRAVMQEIEDAAGELTPELVAKLNSVTASLETKIESYARWYKELDREGKAREEELEYQKRLVAANQNTKEFVKSEIRNALQEMDVTAGKFGNRKVWMQKNSQKSLIIVDEGRVPRDFIRLRPEVMRDDLKSYIEAGNEVDGCSVVQGYHLRIS